MDMYVYYLILMFFSFLMSLFMALESINGSGKMVVLTLSFLSAAVVAFLTPSLIYFHLPVGLVLTVLAIFIYKKVNGNLSDASAPITINKV